MFSVDRCRNRCRYDHPKNGFVHFGFIFVVVPYTFVLIILLRYDVCLYSLVCAWPIIRSLQELRLCGGADDAKRKLLGLELGVCFWCRVRRYDFGQAISVPIFLASSAPHAVCYAPLCFVGQGFGFNAHGNAQKHKEILE